MRPLELLRSSIRPLPHLGQMPPVSLTSRFVPRHSGKPLQAEKNMEGKKVKVPDEPSSEVCDLCGRPMVIKVGKYGKFLACSGFPECRGTKRLVKDTGGICPKCGKGRMLERKSSKGRIYYGCERYPDCDFMTWDMPVPTKCPKCGSTMFRKGSKLYCAKEGCGYEMPVPKKD